MFHTPVVLRSVVSCLLPPTLLSMLVACAGPARDSVIVEPAAAEPTSLRAAVTDPTGRRVVLPNGMELASIELGDPQGEPVLFLHGYTDTVRSFDGTMRALAARRPDLRLIAYDLRGHGASALPDPARCAPAPEQCFTLAELAADAVGFLDRLGIERAHVVGHSLRSMVAQELAITAPQRVDRVVLIATAVRTAGHPTLDFMLELVEVEWRKLAEERGLAFPNELYAETPLDLHPEMERWMHDNWVDWVVEPAADPGLIAAIIPETMRIPLGTWIGVPRALRSFDNRERLGAISAPVLVLFATQDRLFTEADQVELRTALDRAELPCESSWTWKEYGRLPLPTDGSPGFDLAHNFNWAIPDAIAQDLAGFLRPGGAPTRDRVFADPRAGLVVDAGLARIERSVHCAPAEDRAVVEVP
ncbi:MAG TPA: alpha/beta hydrolase [Thermoanaerobaculia bacterium]|nr:alpha/beta hydrolase [Thermoanaerobaculia bacterium]